MAKKILMVDDERDLVFATKLFLEGRGYEVTAAYDGDDALGQVKDLAPDLVLLDVYMPKMNGWEVLEKLQSDPDTMDIPVVMLTAAVEPEDIRRGWELGNTWYHTKPFDPNDLVRVIDRILSSD